jgi:hypothetical protein
MNSGRQDSLFLAFIMNLTIRFWILKLMLLYVELPQNTIPYDITECTYANVVRGKKLKYFELFVVYSSNNKLKMPP